MAKEFQTIVKVGMNSTGFEASASEVSRKMNLLDSAFKSTSTEAKEFGETQDTLKQKQDILTQKIELQSNKVRKLQAEYEKAKQETGENSVETDKLATRYNNAVGQLTRMEGQLNGVNTALKTEAKDLDKASNEVEKLNNNSKNVDKSADSFGKLENRIKGMVATAVSITAVIGLVKDLTEAFIAQENAEKRLETLMSNVKGTTDANIESIKKYTGELQNLGVIGDEVAMYGASQLATFNLQSESIKTLLPGLEDLAVSVKGVNATQEDMINFGNLIGKAVQGNVGALKRYGVTLTETQEDMIKHGNEMQRVGAVAEALKANFGGLNEAMSDTAEGKIKQMQNAWGDVKEILAIEIIPILLKVTDIILKNMPEIQNTIKSALNIIIPIFEVLGKVVGLVVNNFEILIPLIAGLGAVIVAKNIGNLLTSVTAGLTALGVSGGVTGASLGMLSLEIFLVVGAVAALAVALALLFSEDNEVDRKIDKISGSARNLTSNLQKSSNNIKSNGYKNYNSASDMDDLNSYDTGTNYVSADQVAIIHRGEAIIPAKDNPFNSNGTGVGNVVNNINVNIDAKNVSEFNSVVDYFSNYRQNLRQFA